MNLIYTENDFDEFIANNNFLKIINNNGGMQIPDMFSFYFLLTKLSPTVIVESGIWNGLGTKLIRETLGKDVKIICLDPRNIDINNGFIDNNKNTIYYTGNNFVDFKDIELSYYGKDDILCFFDDHQNAAQRLSQCIDKKCKHIFFNDNYPLNCGSHYSLHHLILNDKRNCFDLNNQYYYSINTFPQIDMNIRANLLSNIDVYHIFPNIYPSKIKMLEGVFDCESFYNESQYDDKYYLFKKYSENYCWNTYVKLK